MARSFAHLISHALLAVVGGLFATGCMAEVDGDDTDENSDALGCTAEGETQSCEVPADSVAQGPGWQTCVRDESGDLTWAPCEVETAASTPLVLSFDNAAVELIAAPGGFDVNGMMSVVTDWPTSATPWLALDRNGNGSIDDGGELFGSATVLRSGERADNGFTALRELDTNSDGRITPDDAGWSKLLVWSDRNSDRSTGAGEISSADSLQLTSIDLAFTRERRCDARGNCGIERASFRFRDASGAERSGTVIDVHLKHQ